MTKNEELENKIKKGLKDVLTVKELNKSKKAENVISPSPVQEALKDFKNNQGYDFLDMLTNPKTRKKHILKQLQIPNYDDNDQLEEMEYEQGDND
jgi:hypothetical protein